MKGRQTCILYSQDARLVQRVSGMLALTAQVRHIDSAAELEDALGRAAGCVVLADLAADGLRDGFQTIQKEHPLVVMIALGVPGSEPFIEAESAGVYAVEDAAVPRRRLQALLARAFEHSRLVQENALLKEEAVKSRAASAPGARGVQTPPIAQSRRFPGALQRFDDLAALLQNVVDDVAGSFMVSRAGVFCRTRGQNVYELRAGLRCLGDTKRLRYDENDPMVRWLTLHAHLISRASVEHVADYNTKLLLMQTLDALGAEAIVPLQARDQLLGWLFVGKRSCGAPFDDTGFENLVMMADHVATILDNAMLYEEAAVQKTLAETLLHSMPTAIVSADGSGIVRWFNDSARQILEMEPEKVLNQRVEALGSRLADCIRRALREDIPEQPDEWTDARTNRVLSVQLRRLQRENQCMGVVALIADITIERMLEEKQDQLERTMFWTELAASMSHEIRNPLVAIKTFSQLLPDRYDEPEFRQEYSRVVCEEVERLGSIVDQINHFAHPGELKMQPVDLRRVLKRGMDGALKKHAKSGVWIDTMFDDELPTVLGDDSALAECFEHIITNSMEALADHTNARIVLSAKRVVDSDGDAGVAVTIKDNGGGIPEQIRNKLFSPFCTTKARGMGLGLPIAKRTVVDHDGRISVDSGDQGTVVTVLLPLKRKDKTS